MPISSVFQVVSEDPEQIESLVTTLNGYVTTTAASEAAAAASETNAAVSETNAAASAAAALVSKNAAANSAASTASDAASATTSATNAATSATTASGHATSTAADAVQTAADRVQTGLDRIATAADAVSTAADAVSTAADAASASSDASAASSSAAAALVSQNAAATSETNAAASATSAAANAASTAADAASTAADAVATAADRVQTALDATSASNSASAANTSATAAAASQVSAAASAASAAAVFNDFEDRYYGPHASDSAAQTHVTGLGLTVDQGDLYFNSTANEMRVYDGGSWIAASSAGGASLINYNFTATASQTAFTGSDDNSNTLSYTVDNLIVTRNGVVLEDGTDYTATDGSTITLSVAAAAGDEINVVAFKSFTTADMVSATNGGTFQSNVTVNGTMTATAFSGDGSALTGITIPTLSSLGIANHDQVTVTAGGAVTATSFSGDGSALTGIPTPTLTSLGIANHDDITVDGSGNLGIGGTATANGAGYTTFGVNGSTAGIIEHQANGVRQAQSYATTSAFTTGSITAIPMTFGTGNTERMRITSGGRVGIGTANPLAKLHTYGADALMRLDDTNGGISFFGHDVTGAYWRTFGTDTHRFLRASGYESMRIDSSGNVGIGGSPSAKLSVNDANGIPIHMGDISAAPTSQTAAYVGVSTNSLTGGNGDLVLAPRTSDARSVVFYTGNGTSAERMRIDSSGRVTMPYQPAFHAYGTTAAWTVFSNGGWTTLALNATTFNTGNHYNTGSYAFTAPVTGVYHFDCKVYGRVQSGGAASTYWMSRFHKNGSGITGSDTMLMAYQYATGGTDETATYSMNISLAANDQITLHAQSAGAYNGEYYSLYCEFGGYLIG